jgi:hypothetical protein
MSTGTGGTRWSCVYAITLSASSDACANPPRYAQVSFPGSSAGGPAAPQPYGPQIKQFKWIAN